MKKQFTKAEVKSNGEYLGFIERPNGTVNQFWQMGGIVFCECGNKWFCEGKASKFHAIER